MTPKEEMAIEREVTEALQVLIDEVGIFRADFLFSLAGLNSDDPTWETKADEAWVLVEKFVKEMA